MGGAASRAKTAFAAVPRRAPATPAAAAAVAPLPAATQPSHASAAALGAPPAPAAPPQTDAEGKDESLDSLMARLGGAIRGHAVGVRNTQEGAATQQRRLPRRGSQQGQPSPVVREVFRLHRDERRSPAELAAAFSLDAATLERALRAAALPRIREVQVGVPPTARRIAGE